MGHFHFTKANSDCLFYLKIFFNTTHSSLWSNRIWLSFFSLFEIASYTDSNSILLGPKILGPRV